MDGSSWLHIHPTTKQIPYFLPAANAKTSKPEGEQTHGEVFAVEFEVLPHADKQVQVVVVQQQVNRDVPLPARLQEVTQQLYVTETVHHNG